MRSDGRGEARGYRKCWACILMELVTNSSQLLYLPYYHDARYTSVLQADWSLPLSLSGNVMRKLHFMEGVLLKGRSLTIFDGADWPHLFDWNKWLHSNSDAGL